MRSLSQPTICRFPTLGKSHPKQDATPLILFQDTYSTDRAAGAVNGTAAEPGADTRVVVDTGNRVTISGGSLLVATGGGSSDPRLTYTGITAIAGLCLVATVKQNQDSTENIILRVGWDTATTGVVDAECLELTSSAVINARWASASAQDVGTAYARLTDYQIAILYTAGETYWYIKGGAFADWTQGHTQSQSRVSGAATMYPSMTSYNRAGACAYLAVGVLPVPYRSDSLSLTAGLKAQLNFMF